MPAGNAREAVHAQNDAHLNTAANENGENMVVFEILGTMVENSAINGSPFAQSPVPLYNNYHPLITDGSLEGDSLMDLSPAIRIPRDELYHRLHRSQLWMLGLFEEFFHPCRRHAGYSGNECKFLWFSSFGKHSLDFAILCKHCLNDCKSFGTCLQVCRYMYQNVIRVEDLSGLYNPSGIQAYTINGKRAVLIQPRIPSPRALIMPVFKNVCDSCNVPLRPDCTYCSLYCKLWSQTSIEPQTPPLVLRLDSGLRISTLVDPQIMEPTSHVISEVERSGIDENSIRRLTDWAEENYVEVQKRRRKRNPTRSHEI